MYLDDRREAVGLVLTAFEAPPDGSIFVRKSPAATVAQIARVWSRLQPKRVRQQVIGVRPGEKLHEDLVATGEAVTDGGDFLRVGPGGTVGPRFSSLDAPRLTDAELADLLLQAPRDEA